MTEPGRSMPLVTFDFYWEVLNPYWIEYVQGLIVTLFIAFVALLVSMAIGLVVALLRMSGAAPLKVVAAGYVWAFRAVPIYVYLLWVYYGISLLVHFNFSAWVAGVLVLGTQFGAFQAEVFRSGLQAIAKGQSEAALSVGLTRLQSLVHILMPQVIRLVLPPSGNTFIYIVKETSLLSLIGVLDLTGYAQLGVAITYRPFEFYTVLGGFYLAVVLLLSLGVRRLERSFAIPGS
jgi:polar amino acid transport system permease protein